MSNPALVDLTIEVDGTVLETTASHAVKDKKNRFTVIHLDFAEIYKNTNIVRDVAYGSLHDFDNSLAPVMHTLPGCVFETNNSISVKFKQK